MQVAFAGKRKNLLAAITGQLDEDVGRRAEAVQTDGTAGFHQSISPVADQPGAQQRCGLDVVIVIG